MPNQLPLIKILEAVKELIARGYDPKPYLAYFLISDEGGLLRHE